MIIIYYNQFRFNIFRVIKDFMVQGGDFVNVSYLSFFGLQFNFM